ncbi:hypothetical protein ACS15_3880 [Ralstonia insidiosa]|uniref:Uncharacterized protein n=1 Tax=Ralstonia insidiosa TaxID=190721 RepID=A0AAC9FSG7_9RALS|nr:hypothetical protein ACS15_3880 [Ralstonia insidiosa]
MLPDEAHVGLLEPWSKLLNAGCGPIPAGWSCRSCRSRVVGKVCTQSVGLSWPDGEAV